MKWAHGWDNFETNMLFGSTGNCITEENVQWNYFICNSFFCVLMVVFLLSPHWIGRGRLWGQGSIRWMSKPSYCKSVLDAYNWGHYLEHSGPTDTAGTWTFLTVSVTSAFIINFWHIKFYIKFNNPYFLNRKVNIHFINGRPAMQAQTPSVD